MTTEARLLAQPGFEDTYVHDHFPHDGGRDPGRMMYPGEITLPQAHFVLLGRDGAPHIDAPIPDGELTFGEIFEQQGNLLSLARELNTKLMARFNELEALKAKLKEPPLALPVEAA